MNLKNTALILIGLQNDYFAQDGILHGVIEESTRVNGVVNNIVSLLERVGDEFGAVITTPIYFTRNYSELQNPVGILKAVKDANAFQKGTNGAAMIKELLPFRHLITEVSGKQGLNGFINTHLEATLREKGIKRVVLAGAVTSVCIDSTGRSAAEKGFDVTVLSDCTSGRTLFEQEFYCENIFPLYAEVRSSYTLDEAVDTALA